ncbi:hypothetical protein, partial [Aeromonas veronii]|uniref:hypothetical protein n=1 Tax=Aeromonas veronii TaxID=654 RepID=UPI001F25E0B1
IAGVEEVEGLFDTHKKSETNQQVSDFHTTEGSVNGSLTDQHYGQRLLLLLLPASHSSRHPDSRWQDPHRHRTRLV